MPRPDALRPGRAGRRYGGSRRLFGALLACAVAVVAVVAGTPALAQQLPAGDAIAAGFSIQGLELIDTLAEGYVERGEMPGVLIVIARHGRVVHTVKAGYRGVETRAAVSLDTIYRMFSMTKPVTGVAIMQLIERGAIGLTDPVADYLPEFASLAAAMNDDPGVTEPARPMTILHLLTHTSGLTYDDAGAGGVPALYAAADLYSGPDLATFITRLAALPLASQPGTRWEYGVSMDVLGRIVEVASGERFDDYLAAHIFEPLGMLDTGFHVPDNKIHRFAASYRRTPEGGIRLTDVPATSRYRTAGGAAFGGHGIVSTPIDYARFAAMLVNGGELDGVRILSEASVDSLVTDHMGPEYGPHPLTDSWLGDTARGLGFGLTGAVVRDGEANTIPGSNGAFFWGGAASTFFWVDRAAGLFALEFTQLMPSDAYPIREQLRRLTYQALTGR
jgi:CubicO group peptidase (beta-lactamase class C family)